MAIDPLIINQILIKQRQAGIRYRVSKRPTPMWLFPDRWQREYQSRLITYVDMMEALYNKIIDSKLGLSLRDRDISLNIKRDGWVDDIDNFTNEFNLVIDSSKAQAMHEILDGIPQGTERFNRAQWDKIIKAKLGVEIFQNEPFLVPLIQNWTKINAGLITSLSEDVKKNVEVIVRQDFIQGKRHEEIRNEIQSSFNTTRNRAKLIARDQISKLNGDLTNYRQTNLGIIQYSWMDSDDQRVRQTHAAHDGKLIRWDEPPADTGHPGQDYQCRCWADPDFGVIDDALKAEERHVPAIDRPNLFLFGVR